MGSPSSGWRSATSRTMGGSNSRCPSIVTAAMRSTPHSTRCVTGSDRRRSRGRCCSAAIRDGRCRCSLTEELLSRAVPDVAAFRAEFPVLERLAYFNSGSVGPVPRRALDAVEERMRQEVEEGRIGRSYLLDSIRLGGELRARYSTLLGCDAAEVALTPSTTDGVNTILSGLELRAGDLVLTTDEEHPGVLAPLGAARQRAGIEVRVVPWDEIASEVGDRTRLVVCSHVSWVTGRAIDMVALAATGVSVLLDGAQALGAIPVDVHALGCDFYAASGQKWLCGPEASGCLYVRAASVEQLRVAWPGYASLAGHEAPLELVPQEGAARFHFGLVPGLRSRWALA